MVAEAASRIRPGAGVRRIGGRTGPRRGVRLGIGARPVPGRGARRFVGLPRSPGRDSTAAPRPGVAPFPGRAVSFTGRFPGEALPCRGGSAVAGSVGSGFRSRHREFSASGTREPYGAAATGTVAPRREFRLVPVPLPTGPLPADRIGGSNRVSNRESALPGAAEGGGGGRVVQDPALHHLHLGRRVLRLPSDRVHRTKRRRVGAPEVTWPALSVPRGPRA